MSTTIYTQVENSPLLINFEHGINWAKDNVKKTFEDILPFSPYFPGSPKPP